MLSSTALRPQHPTPSLSAAPKETVHSQTPLQGTPRFGLASMFTGGLQIIAQVDMRLLICLLLLIK